VGDRPVHKPPPPDISESSQRLLQQIREADLANAICADCSTDQKVDWVSINLGIMICIECSGIHRSLGTHISKVRSVTLDPNSFTPDVIALLHQIGNRVSNSIWEAKLLASTEKERTTIKPTAQSNREQRLKFISAKYVDRIYVQPISTTLSHFATANETLLASIKKNDITNVLYALALRANPNSHDKSRNTHVVFLALAAADPASPSASSSPQPPSSPRIGSPSASMSGSGKPPSSAAGGAATTARKTFAVAELLVLNGAEVPAAATSPIPLSASAKVYLESKAEQKTGRKQTVGSTSAPGMVNAHGAVSASTETAGGGQAGGEWGGGVGTGGDTLTALPVFGSVKGEREEKLRHRISKDGKLVRQLGGGGGGGGGGSGGSGGP
jgi:Arf-GAP/SH3 domain/ANK repeat/PH domain-containing protein